MKPGFLIIITKHTRANIYSLICTICRVHFARRRNGKSVVLVMTPFYACFYLCTTRCAFRPTLLLERNGSYILKVLAMFTDIIMQYLCCTDMMACTTRLAECIACNYIGCKLYF